MIYELVWPSLNEVLNSSLLQQVPPLRLVVSDCGLLEKGENFGKREKQSWKQPQTTLSYLLAGELITGPQLPSEQALFGVVKSRLFWKPRAKAQKGKSDAGCGEAGGPARSGFFRKLLEDVLWGMVMCVSIHD